MNQKRWDRGITTKRKRVFRVRDVLRAVERYLRESPLTAEAVIKDNPTHCKIALAVQAIALGLREADALYEELAIEELVDQKIYP